MFFFTLNIFNIKTYGISIFPLAEVGFRVLLLMRCIFPLLVWEK